MSGLAKAVDSTDWKARHSCSALRISSVVDEKDFDTEPLDRFLKEMGLKAMSAGGVSGPLRIKARGKEALSVYAFIESHEHPDETHYLVSLSVLSVQPRTPDKSTPQVSAFMGALSDATKGSDVLIKVRGHHEFQTSSWKGVMELPYSLPFHSGEPTELVGIQVGFPGLVKKDLVLLSVGDGELSADTEFWMNEPFSRKLLDHAVEKSGTLSSRLVDGAREPSAVVS